MEKNYVISFDLNKFLNDIKLKKQYVKNFKNKISLLSNVKDNNYKILNSIIAKKKTFNKCKYDNLVMYIIYISFSKSNTFFHVLDSAGNLKIFWSAGSFNYSGKNKKKDRLIIFKEFYNVLLGFHSLKSKPIAVHFKSVVGFHKFKIIKLLKKKFFIKIMSSFNNSPHNGCRKRKVRRKKNLKNKERWLSGLKRQIVNLLSFLLVGSNPALFIIFSEI